MSSDQTIIAPLQIDFLLTERISNKELDRLRLTASARLLLNGPDRVHDGMPGEAEAVKLATPWPRFSHLLSQNPSIDWVNDAGQRSTLGAAVLSEMHRSLAPLFTSGLVAYKSIESDPETPFRYVIGLAVEESRYTEAMETLIEELAFVFFGEARIDLIEDSKALNGQYGLKDAEQVVTLTTGDPMVDDLPGQGDVDVTLRILDAKGIAAEARRSFSREGLNALIRRLDASDRCTPSHRMDSAAEALRSGSQRLLNRLLPAHAQLSLEVEDWSALQPSPMLVIEGASEMPGLPFGSEVCSEVLEALDQTVSGLDSSPQVG